MGGNEISRNKNNAESAVDSKLGVAENGDRVEVTQLVNQADYTDFVMKERQNARTRGHDLRIVTEGDKTYLEIEPKIE